MYFGGCYAFLLASSLALVLAVPRPLHRGPSADDLIPACSFKRDALGMGIERRNCSGTA
ncbi:hypothetical protein EXIGLDRAFT_773561 [Exidia glandulosa HHB12029]|uniref:Uncharacterized protein n=1 Tax=Exidia glandulosa HHB12029 TaxID=1314781 RepID=A0A165EQP7_EXIGL|nr:hypothetical protein EXIGLDRAFT_773561 [Exidia glandulosa HHB12029]